MVGYLINVTDIGVTYKIVGRDKTGMFKTPIVKKIY